MTPVSPIVKNTAVNRFFDPDPAIRNVAVELYHAIADLAIVSPHGHVAPDLFSDPKATFGSPADLFIIPDHYVTRMLYSQGIPLESLGVPRRDNTPVEQDHRKIWRTFCENFHLFRGTPSGIWLTDELITVFDIDEKPSASNADGLYDLIAEKLASPDFSPRKLFEQFNIEVLCTTDAATETLEHHQVIRESGWSGRILPTFRPDGVVNLDAHNWRASIDITPDETTYSRELAPLAGHYPALKLCPPWWFFDSLNDMARYFDQVMETAGIYNTVGFNDDTRAFCSIPARHDVWRRASANWLAGLVVRHIIDMDDGREMSRDLAVNLTKRAYKL